MRILDTAVVQEPPAWVTPYVRDTCMTPFDDVFHLLHVLGVDTDSCVGSLALPQHFRQVGRKVSGVHERFMDHGMLAT